MLALVLANVRTPEIRLADLQAQMAANRVGGERFGDFPRRLYPVEGRDIPSTFQGFWEFDYRMQRAL